MTRADVLDRFAEVVDPQLGLSREDFTEEATFGEDLQMDSLDLTDFVMGLEDSFEIKIPEDDLKNVRTVGQAVDLVVEKLGLAAPAGAVE